MRLLIRNLTVEVEDKRVIEGASIEVARGEVVGLTGENGSGKTTLAQVLMGSDRVKVLGGEVKFEGSELLSIGAEERVRAGVYVSWQNPVAVFGVSIFNLAKAAYQAKYGTIENLVDFRTEVEELLLKVGLLAEYVKRGVNEGMSGGERKRLELMLMLLLKPKLVVLDEIDSGMDQVGREMTVRLVRELSEEGTSFLVISHYADFLKELGVSRSWQMSAGVTRQND